MKVRLSIACAVLATIVWVTGGSGCDDPPAVPSPDAGNVSERIEALREKVGSESAEMRLKLDPVLSDVSTPKAPDAGSSK